MVHRQRLDHKSNKISGTLKIKIPQPGNFYLHLLFQFYTIHTDMRIQTLIFTALLFILPTIAVGSNLQCLDPNDPMFQTQDKEFDSTKFKEECEKKTECVYTHIKMPESHKCEKCAAGTYKNTPANLCTNCTNKPNADAAKYLITEDYAGMQANICPWDLTCNKNTQFIQQNNSCQACQPHQYNEETYVIYNIKGVQSGSPGYTYQKINDNGTYGDQLSSAPQCNDKTMIPDWNMPYKGASLSGRLPRNYTCKSKDNKIEISFINGYYELVGYSIGNEKEVDADYQCTKESNCYDLNYICQEKEHNTKIYAIWKPAKYQIYYYFGSTHLQTVNADFSTPKNIDDITNLISTKGLQWPNNEDMVFHVYDNDTLKTNSEGKEIFQINNTIPHPSNAGQNISIKILCPAGYYCENEYAADNYKQCPDGKTSTPGSTKKDECTYSAYTKFCDLNGCMTFK